MTEGSRFNAYKLFIYIIFCDLSSYKTVLVRPPYSGHLRLQDTHELILWALIFTTLKAVFS